MADIAEACINQLLSNGRDYTLLLYLPFWDFLDKFPKGLKLKEFIEIEMGLHRVQVECKEFHDRVTSEFQTRGIQNLAPKRMVHAYRKEELFQLMAFANWPEPYFPFILQMRPGVFIAFSTWLKLAIKLARTLFSIYSSNETRCVYCLFHMAIWISSYFMDDWMWISRIQHQKASVYYAI